MSYRDLSLALSSTLDTADVDSHCWTTLRPLTSCSPHWTRSTLKYAYHHWTILHSHVFICKHVVMLCTRDRTSRNSDLIFRIHIPFWDVVSKKRFCVGKHTVHVHRIEYSTRPTSRCLRCKTGWLGVTEHADHVLRVWRLPLRDVGCRSCLGTSSSCRWGVARPTPR